MRLRQHQAVLTRDPELRALPSGKTIPQFSVATEDYCGGEERGEFHSFVTWVLSVVGRTRV